MYIISNHEDPIELVIARISEIPPWEIILSLEDANIIAYTADEVWNIFSAIPEWVREVYIADASIVEIARAFGSLPRHLDSLGFLRGNLNGTAEQVTEALSFIPDTVRAFQLSECTITMPGVVSAERFLALSKALPRNLTSFHFIDTFNLPLVDESILIQAAKLLPPNLITFTVNFNSYQSGRLVRRFKDAFSGIYSFHRRNRTSRVDPIDVQRKIPEIIATLPKEQTSLDLRYMNLGFMTGLERIAEALPDGVTLLDLRHNSLCELSPGNLIGFFAALASKPNLTHLLLSWNGLYSKTLPIVIETLIVPKSGLQWIELFDGPMSVRYPSLQKLLAALECSPNIIQFVRSNVCNNETMNELPIKRRHLEKKQQILTQKQHVFSQAFALLYHANMDLFFSRTNKSVALPAEIIRNIFVLILGSYGFATTHDLLTELESVMQQAAAKALSDYKESKPVVDAWYELQATCRREKPSSIKINWSVSQFLRKITSMAILGQVFEEFMKDEPGYRVDKNYAEPSAETMPPKRVYPPGRLAVIQLFQKRAQKCKPDLINTLPHILSTAPVEPVLDTEPARAGPANA